MNLDDQAFWEVMEACGWAYLITLDGKRRRPPRGFASLVDDLNRALADYICFKMAEGGRLEADQKSEYPVWVKIGKGPPFIEFRIADALRHGGAVYSYEYGAQPPEKVVEAARQVLTGTDLHDIWVIPERTHYAELANLQAA